MTTYEPGTIAVATVRGVKGVRIVKSESEGAWFSGVKTGGDFWHWSGDVTDIRRLVVLDIEYVDSQWTDLQWTDLVAYLRAGTWRDIADQIEAQTKAPRIPEPGQFGVVVAGHGRIGAARPTWVRLTDPETPGAAWHGSEGTWAHWADLIDPSLIREGLS